MSVKELQHRLRLLTHERGRYAITFQCESQDDFNMFYDGDQPGDEFAASELVKIQDEITAVTRQLKQALKLEKVVKP